MSSTHSRRSKAAEAELVSWVCTCGNVQEFDAWDLTEDGFDVQDRDTKFACDDCGGFLDNDRTLVNYRGDPIKKYGGLNLMDSRLEIYGWQCCQCVMRKVNMPIDKKLGGSQHSCVTNGYHADKPHHCPGCYVVNKNYEVLTTMESPDEYTVGDRVPRGALREHWDHWRRIQENTTPGPLLGKDPEQVLDACEKFARKQFETAARNKRRRARDGQIYDSNTVHENYRILRGLPASASTTSGSGASTSAQDAAPAETPDVEVEMTDVDSDGSDAQTPRGAKIPQETMRQDEDYTVTMGSNPQPLETSPYQQNHPYQASAFGGVTDFSATQPMDYSLSPAPIGQFYSQGSPGNPDLANALVNMNPSSQRILQTGGGHAVGSPFHPWPEPLSETVPDGYHPWNTASPGHGGNTSSIGSPSKDKGKSPAAMPSTSKGSSRSKSSGKSKGKSKSHSRSSDKGVSSSSPSAYASPEAVASYASPSYMENFQEEGFYDPDGNFIPYGPPPEEGFRAWEQSHGEGYQ